MKIGAYIMICERDAVRWWKQLSDSILKMDMDISWYLDHCSPETKKKIREFPKTVSVIEEDEQRYLEKFRSKPFWALQKLGYDWIFHWDSDETWSDNAPELIRKDFETAGDSDVVCFPMVTAWEKDGTPMARVDSIFRPGTVGTQTYRQRGFNAKYEWNWLDPITVGGHKIVGGAVCEDSRVHYGKATTIHWGYSTDALRNEHKQTWDENYTYAIGRNPYGLWDFITDPSRPVELEELKKIVCSLENLKS